MKIVRNLRTSNHIRTMRMIRSFRSCINTTGQSPLLADLGRVYIEECKRLDRIKILKTKGACRECR